MSDKPAKVRANDHESYGTFTLISLVLPIVGFILGIVYLTKDTPVDKKLGEHLIAISILFGIIGFVAWQFFLSNQLSSTYYP